VPPLQQEEGIYICPLSLDFGKNQNLRKYTPYNKNKNNNNNKAFKNSKKQA
jgi:hypothetical protein